MPQRVTGSRRLRGWQVLCRQLSSALGQLELNGLARVPETGAVILAVNHTSAFDGVVLFGHLDRPVSFLVKAEAFEPVAGLVGRLLIQGAQLPVRRARSIRRR